jgi:hypothetical protein
MVGYRLRVETTRAPTFGQHALDPTPNFGHRLILENEFRERRRLAVESSRSSQCKRPA